MASYIETFLVPYNEIAKRFRKSELLLMGWITGERAANMDKRMKSRASGYVPPPPAVKGRKPPPGRLPGKLAESCFNKDGEPDMRQMTSAQAVRYLRAVGFSLMAPPDVEQQIEALGDEEGRFDAETHEPPENLEVSVQGVKLKYKGLEELP